MLVVVPTDELVSATAGVAGVAISVHALASTDVDVGAEVANVAGWIAGNAQTYGAYAHGSAFSAYLVGKLFPAYEQEYNKETGKCFRVLTACM